MRSVQWRGSQAGKRYPGQEDANDSVEPRVETCFARGSSLGTESTTTPPVVERPSYRNPNASLRRPRNSVPGTRPAAGVLVFLRVMGPPEVGSLRLSEPLLLIVACRFPVSLFIFLPVPL